MITQITTKSMISMLFAYSLVLAICAIGYISASSTWRNVGALKVNSMHDLLDDKMACVAIPSEEVVASAAVSPAEPVHTSSIVESLYTLRGGKAKRKFPIKKHRYNRQS